MTTAPREITAPVELVRPDGRLNPDAVGWSRRPLHDTSGVKRGLRGLGRNKRWEYWLVTTPEVLVSLTLSDIDYAGVHTVWAYERATGRRVDESAVVPFAWHTDLPGSLGAGVAEAGSRGLAGRIEETAGGTRLRARAEGVRFDVTAGRLGAGGRTRCGGTGPPGPATRRRPGAGAAVRRQVDRRHRPARERRRGGRHAVPAARFGTWHGTVTAGGEQLEVDGVLGFAEDVRNRW